MHAHRHLEQLVVLGELEQAVIDAEHAQGLTPAGMHRPLTPPEVRSKVNFAAMDQAVTTAGQQTSSALTDLRDVIVAYIIAAVTVLPGANAVQAAINQFASKQPPEVQTAIRRATADIEQTLNDLYSTGADEVVREAVQQGVTPAEAVADGLSAAEGEFTATASVAPTAVWSGILSAAVKAGGAMAANADEVTNLVTSASIAGPQDLARQAVNVVHGLGRQAAANGMGETPLSVYASELLDGATCEPCQHVDGREYISLDDAYADYPDAGPYINCDGGDRCRGSLLFVYDESFAPSSPDGELQDA